VYDASFQSLVRSDVVNHLRSSNFYFRKLFHPVGIIDIANRPGLSRPPWHFHPQGFCRCIPMIDSSFLFPIIICSNNIILIILPANKMITASYLYHLFASQDLMALITELTYIITLIQIHVYLHTYSLDLIRSTTFIMVEKRFQLPNHMKDSSRLGK